MGRLPCLFFCCEGEGRRGTIGGYGERVRIWVMYEI
nr:MAG TPA: hypothetical protein [Caudoviricetes sp.]